MLQLLENAEYKVNSILDGSAIIARMEKVLPDLLLLDISMPGIDGAGICEEIKRNKRLGHIPIIIMSAHNDIKKMAEKAGADDFIAKPFAITDLLRVIKRNLSLIFSGTKHEHSFLNKIWEVGH